MSGTGVQLLKEAIAVPSVNPAHGDDPAVSNERRMADWLQAQMETRGLSVERIPLMGPERPAIIGRNAPAEAKRSLMLEVHLDTVGTAGMTVDPFGGVIEDGKLYGRGACDMKGSTCALLAALTPERIQSLTDRGIQLLFVGAPDEETGLTGSRQLAEQGLRADDAVILEPTRCVPVIAHKGAHWYELTLEGIAGHGSQPEKGVSTHEALSRLLPELYRIHEEEASAHPHALLGTSTLNIGRIEGGKTFNVIPDFTRLELDRRVVAGEDPSRFEQRVSAKLEELVTEGLLVSGALTAVGRTPAFATSDTSPLVNSFLSLLDDGVEPEGTSWVSDASSFSDACEATVVFGPGDIAQAHTVDEFITLEQLERGERIFADFLDGYGCG